MTEVVFVGTSDAFGAGGRRQSAILLRGPSGSVLLDCGMTTLGGLRELQIDPGEVDAILVSHYHGDHFGGIPSLLLAALYEDARTKPLRIAGPPGVQQRVHELARAMAYEIENREWTFPIHFQELTEGRSQQVGPVSASSFRVLHQPHTCPHGLLVETGREHVAYSGDTGWFDALPGHVNGSDLFICECTYHKNGFEFHLNYEHLAERKADFDCGRMILTHLGLEMYDRRGEGEFETADDGLVVRL
jgi:ribonuclease BN (tRNA processing enzyme)